jgi:hypothetical protein
MDFSWHTTTQPYQANSGEKDLHQALKNRLACQGNFISIFYKDRK